MNQRKAISPLEERLSPDMKATLAETLEDCLYIAKKVNRTILMYFHGVDMAITPSSDYDLLYSTYAPKCKDMMGRIREHRMNRLGKKFGRQKRFLIVNGGKK